MTQKPMFNAYEYLLISVALAKFGGPKDITEAALAKLDRNADFSDLAELSTVGRPRKNIDETVDVQRAKVIENLEKDFPDHTIQDLIKIARIFSTLFEMIEAGDVPLDLWNAMPEDMRDELGRPQPLAGLFPKHRDLKSSVSRGKKTLRERSAKLRKS